MPAVPRGINHPLPPPPGQNPPVSSPHQQGLAPPPHAPQGPRSPGIAGLRARTPSPDVLHGSHAVDGSGTYAYNAGAGVARINVVPSSPYPPDEDEDDGEAVRTPVKPSAKALGKRPAMSTEDSDGRFFFYHSAPIGY